MASRLTIKRFDPWSVLKFGAVANLALLAIFMLVAGVVWFIIDRLALVDQVCEMAGSVGFTTCGVNAGNLFRALALLGLLGVVVQTAVLVFLAFLHNLIADLTGGLVIGVIEEPGARREPRRVATAATPPARSTQGARTPAGANPSSATPRQATSSARGTQPRPNPQPGANPQPGSNSRAGANSQPGSSSPSGDSSTSSTARPSTPGSAGESIFGSRPS